VDEPIKQRLAALAERLAIPGEIQRALLAAAKEIAETWSPDPAELEEIRTVGERAAADLLAELEQRLARGETTDTSEDAHLARAMAEQLRSGNPYFILGVFSGLAISSDRRLAAAHRAIGEPQAHAPPAGRRGGRPRGSKTVQPGAPVGEVLRMPSDGALAFALETLSAHARDWDHDPLGRPEYRSQHGRVNGSTVFIRPGEERLTTRASSQAELDAACAALWVGVADLGAAEMQLMIYLSNAWMSLPQATDGVRLAAHVYAEARGLDRARAAARGQAERDRFNATIHRLASLDLHVEINRRTRGQRREIVYVSGRLLMAEALRGVYTGPLEGFDGPQRADVLAWRLVPGSAWLASRALGQIGRYPTALLELDPYRQALAVKLGAYLGYQTTVRASGGTLAQPLSVQSILRGIREEIPEDRRRIADLRARLERALDDLQGRGILTSWHWTPDEPRPKREAFLKGAIAFVYHLPSIDEHGAHHPKAKRALSTPAMQRLLPEGEQRA
jgi:hypothetical protein